VTWDMNEQTGWITEAGWRWYVPFPGILVIGHVCKHNQAPVESDFVSLQDDLICVCPRCKTCISVAELASEGGNRC